MTIWIFSSKNLDHIRTAYERLIWGFWDRDAGKKQRKNWRSFIRAYNNIKPHDIAVFQIAGNGHIHAIGVIKDRFYDDQTPIWQEEIKEKKVLFPWRVRFTLMIFSEEPITTHYVHIENYIDGYGIGEIRAHEIQSILRELHNKQIKVNLHM